MNRVKMLSERKLAVKIKNRNQEKIFIHVCRKNKIHYTKISEHLSYSESRKVHFPYYYTLTEVGSDCQPIAWWSDELHKDYISISAAAFKELLEEDE